MKDKNGIECEPITREEWAKTHRDFKAITKGSRFWPDGTRTMLRNGGAQGTILVPVVIVR